MEETIALMEVSEKALVGELGMRHEASTWEELGAVLGGLLLVVCGRAQVRRALPGKSFAGEEGWAWPKIEEGIVRGALEEADGGENH